MPLLWHLCRLVEITVNQGDAEEEVMGLNVLYF